jgi:hypothetical protein
VYPPRCAYRMYWSYARSQPTSRPKLYEFILVSVAYIAALDNSCPAREAGR